MSEKNTHGLSLREAIEKAISLGSHEPTEIAAKLRTRYDSKWLAVALVAIADDVIADMARQILGSQRRSSLSLARVNRVDRAALMLKAAWLPGIGWVEFGKFKAEDFDQLGATYRKGAAALNSYADWCEATAALMRAEQVDEFRELKAELPELTSGEKVA